LRSPIAIDGRAVNHVSFAAGELWLNFVPSLSRVRRHFTLHGVSDRLPARAGAISAAAPKKRKNMPKIHFPLKEADALRALLKVKPTADMPSRSKPNK
jgi:hypothetical protein